MTEFNDFAKLLAEKSGEIIKKYHRTKVTIESKKDESPVTVADKAAEEVMRELIMKEFPEHGIIGEEFGKHNVAAEYQWVLDPIDGTKSFITGTVNFGTLIALLKNNEPVFGVINQPVLNDFMIGDGTVTTLNNEVVTMRELKNVNEATMLTSCYKDIGKYHDGSKFDKLMQQVKIFRTWGDAYGYSLLAAGFADIMVDAVMSLWDLAAIIPVIRGAGGIITDYYGEDPMTGNSILAANPDLHKQALALIK